MLAELLGEMIIAQRDIAITLYIDHLYILILFLFCYRRIILALLWSTLLVIAWFLCNSVRCAYLLALQDQVYGVFVYIYVVPDISIAMCGLSLQLSSVGKLRQAFFYLLFPVAPLRQCLLLKDTCMASFSITNCHTQL